MSPKTTGATAQMKIDESKKPVVILVCVIAIIVSFVSILKTSCKSQPQYKPQVDRCVGEHMAAEVGKLLNGQGDVVVVVLPRYDVRWDQLPKKGDCNALFDSRYIVVTKTNFEEMAEKLKQFYPMP